MSKQKIKYPTINRDFSTQAWCHFKKAIPFGRIIISLLVELVLLTFILEAGCTNNSSRIHPSLASQLQTVLDDQRRSQGIPGISAAVITQKGQKWFGVSGHSAKKDSLKPEMLFGLGSITKTYIAALVLKLVEEGKLSLDDPVNRWLTSIPFVNGSITIRQLLNHTSGLYRYQQKPEYYESVVTHHDKVWKPQEILDTFLKEPETGWGESAADYVLLGMIIEKATGKRVSTELRERFFIPLKLNRTFLYPDERYPLKNLAHLWWDVDGSGKIVDVLSDTTATSLVALFSSVWTSGAIHSTAEDLAIWTKELFDGHILKEISLKRMITPTTVTPSLQYGFSVVVDKINEKTVYWHTGGIGYCSVYYYIPADSLSIAVLCNSIADPQSIAIELYDKYTKFLEQKI